MTFLHSKMNENAKINFVSPLTDREIFDRLLSRYDIYHALMGREWQLSDEIAVPSPPSGLIFGS